MSLTDILGGVVTLAGAGAIVYCSKELFNRYYIPFTKELEKELEKYPEFEGYKFSDEDKE
jgi:hypothetical protein